MTEKPTDEQLRVMRAWHARRGADDPVHSRVVAVIDKTIALRAERAKLEAALAAERKVSGRLRSMVLHLKGYGVLRNSALAQPAESGAPEPVREGGREG